MRRRLRRLLGVAALIASLAAAGNARADEPVDAYARAEQAFSKALATTGPERSEAMRVAVDALEAALTAEPTRREAPLATLLCAHAYKALGEIDRARSAYARFLDTWASEPVLVALEKGDAKASPPVAPDPRAYAARVKDMELAFAALGASALATLDYASAAAAYERTSNQTRLSTDARRDAAHNAAMLFAGLGDATRLAAARTTLFALQPTPADKAAVDWLVTDLDFRGWDASAPDQGDNEQARTAALRSLEKFYASYKGGSDAGTFIVEAAYDAAALLRAHDEKTSATWCARAVDAFEPLRMRAEAEQRPAPAFLSERAAECALRNIEREIPAALGAKAASNLHAGTPAKIAAASDAELVAVTDKWIPRLEDVIQKYRSPRWMVAARVREASLYDACYVRLWWAPTSNPERVIVDRGGDEPAPIDPEEEEWRAAKRRRVAAIATSAVSLYGEAVTWARAFHVGGPEVRIAHARLAIFTDWIGNERMADAISRVQDPATKQPVVYVDDQFLRGRPLPSAPPSRALLPLSMGAFTGG